VLLAAGIVGAAVVNRDRPNGKDDDAERLRFFDDHAAGLIAVSAVRTLAFLLLLFVVVHLQRATKGRNPELSSAPFVVGLFGVVALALGSIGQALALADKAADFVTQDFPSAAVADRAAEDAAGEALPLVTGVIAFAGTFGLAFWFVLGSLNAMRVGLLTRFMGILGIIIGPGFVFGFAPPVMVFWLIALGVLFLGYWPRGLPAAWENGEAVPWPGRQPVAESTGGGFGTVSGENNGEVEAVGPGVHRAGEQEAAPASPARRKRKRR
jgi:Domain of unknown function (DUF4386)